MKQIIQFFFMFLVAGVLFSSCKGEDGEVGPAANANVKSYAFKEKSFSGDYLVLSVPAITQDVLDKGVVTVYVTVSGESMGWFPLPIVGDNNQNITLIQIGLGKLMISKNYDIKSTKLDVKVVVIEGTSTSNLRKGN
jgi:hypothetical protein